MPTRRRVRIPDDIDTVGQTNRFLKLPFAAPKNDREHAANARELERAVNRIPVSSGATARELERAVNRIPVSSGATPITIDANGADLSDDGSGRWTMTPILLDKPGLWLIVGKLYVAGDATIEGKMRVFAGAGPFLVEAREYADPGLFGAGPVLYATGLVVGGMGGWFFGEWTETTPTTRSASASYVAYKLTDV